MKPNPKLTRRSIMTIGVAGLAGCSIPKLDSNTQPKLPTSWPITQYSSTRSSHLPHSTIPATQPKYDKISVSDEIVYYMSPIVSTGKNIYVKYATGDGRPHTSSITSIDHTSGKANWETAIDNHSDKLNWGQVTIGDSSVYATSSRGVHSLNKKTGELQWEYELDGSKGSPVIKDGAVFAQTQGSDADTIVSIDTASGSLNWKKDISGRIAESLSVANDTVFAATNTGVIALNQSSGETNWEQNTENQFGSRSSPAIEGNQLFLTHRGNSDKTEIIARDTRTGSITWKSSIPTTQLFAPAVGKSTIVVGGNNSLHAFDKDGTKQWTYDAGGMTGYFNPVLVGDDVLAVSNRGTLLSINSKTAEDNWKYDWTNDDTVPYITGVNSNIFISNRSGTLYKFSF